MPENGNEFINSLVAILAVLCICALIFRIIYHFLRDKFSPVISEKAQVIDKYVVDNFSKIYGSLAKKPQYYVVFSVGTKKRSFRVSEFSYRGYKLKDRGTLKYKGSRLIDFR